MKIGMWRKEKDEMKGKIMKYVYEANSLISVEQHIFSLILSSPFLSCFE